MQELFNCKYNYFISEIVTNKKEFILSTNKTLIPYTSFLLIIYKRKPCLLKNKRETMARRAILRTTEILFVNKRNIRVQV